MSEEQKKNNKGFNAYWIYAIIAVLLISFSLLNSGGRVIKIEDSDFYDLAEHGYIEKLNFVKNKEIGEIYLKQDSLDAIKNFDEKYKNIVKKESFGGGSPDLTFTTPDRESFEKDLETI